MGASDSEDEWSTDLEGESDGEVTTDGDDQAYNIYIIQIICHFQQIVANKPVVPLGGHARALISLSPT